MFTGLVQHVGQVSSACRSGEGFSLVVNAGSWGHRPERGESVAVNGCCLTVVGGTGGTGGIMEFDVVRQTMEVTSLSKLREGSRVNLEHAMRLSDLVGGHLVQGHIDGTGEVQSVVRRTMEHRLRIGAGAEIAEYLVEKGSIAVEGVSLTLASVGDGWFDVALIPATLELTTLGELKAGDHVNLEADSMAKTVVMWLKRFGERGFGSPR